MVKKTKYIGISMAGFAHVMQTMYLPLVMSIDMDIHPAHDPLDGVMKLFEKNFLNHYVQRSASVTDNYDYLQHTTNTVANPYHNAVGDRYNDYHYLEPGVDTKIDYSHFGHEGFNYYGDRLVDLSNDPKLHTDIVFADQDPDLNPIESFENDGIVQVISK